MSKGKKADDQINSDTVDLIEDLVVSPERIDHGKASPKGEAVWLITSGRINWRPKAENW